MYPGSFFFIVNMKSDVKGIIVNVVIIHIAVFISYCLLL